MAQNDADAVSAVTALIVATFRLNGALIEAGDALVRDLGLTSARWQVLGAIALEGRPLTVAQIARRMGLTRQAVQRLVNELSSDDLLALTDNPDHKRARLVALSAQGADAFGKASERQRLWAAGLAEGLSVEGLSEAAALLRRLDERLRGQESEAG